VPGIRKDNRALAKPEDHSRRSVRFSDRTIPS